jgi:MoxR-like ATPase
VRQVAGGTGRTLVVVGEAGIGKTRVVAAGLAEADELGVWVLTVPWTSWSSGARSA